MEISDAQARNQPTTLFDSFLRLELQEGVRLAATLEMYLVHWYLVDGVAVLPTGGIPIRPTIGDSAT